MVAMKKVLLILCLCMAIVTSIISGTLAIYNKTLSPTDIKIGARYFYIGSGGSANIETSLAPNERTYHKFYVTNTKDDMTTEVDMDLNIQVVVGDAINTTAIKNLNVSLEYLKHDGHNEDAPGQWNTVPDTQVIEGTGTINITIPKAFLADTPSVKSYRLNIFWPPENDNKKDTEDGWYPDNEMLTAMSNIKITITGNQSI
jgi:hypothetical protein